VYGSFLEKINVGFVSDRDVLESIHLFVEYSWVRCNLTSDFHPI
jgi:hypothetical protein